MVPIPPTILRGVITTHETRLCHNYSRNYTASQPTKTKPAFYVRENMQSLIQKKKKKDLKFERDSFDSGWGQAAGLCERCNELTISFRGTKFREQVRDCQFLKKDSAPRSLLITSFVGLSQSHLARRWLYIKTVSVLQLMSDSAEQNYMTINQPQIHTHTSVQKARASVWSLSEQEITNRIEGSTTGYERVYKIFRTGTAIYTAFVVARSTGTWQNYHV
jgi:hypothetical protein